MSDESAETDRPQDDYDTPRIAEWDTLDEARAAAIASPALHTGSVLIRWEGTAPDGTGETRFSWRDTHVGGLYAPDGTIVCEMFRDGHWVEISEDDDINRR